MTQRTSDDSAMRPMLRAYLLETLSESEKEAVERHLAESAEWRRALARERRAIRALGILPDAAPSHDLATGIMVEAARQGRPVRRWRIVECGVAAAAVCVIAWVLLPALARPREASRRASAQNNLKQLGLVMKMYVHESASELFPPLAPIDGVWTFDVSRLYPEYLTDPSILVSPLHPDAADLYEKLSLAASQTPPDYETMTRVAAQSYVYLGWHADTPSDVGRIVEARNRRGEDFSSVRSIDPDADFAPNIYRLREGIERFFITDINNPAASNRAQSTVPIIFETPQISSSRGGSNVLYMDGHVEFVKAGSFPALPEVNALLFPGSSSR